MRFTGKHEFTGNLTVNNQDVNFINVKYKLNIPLTKSNDFKYGDIFISNNQLIFGDSFNNINSILPINNIDILKILFLGTIQQYEYNTLYKNINISTMYFDITTDYTIIDSTSLILLFDEFTDIYDIFIT